MMAVGNLSVIEQPRYVLLLQHSWRSPWCSVLPYKADSLCMGSCFLLVLEHGAHSASPFTMFFVVRETYLSTIKLCRGVLQTPKKGNSVSWSHCSVWSSIAGSCSVGICFVLQCLGLCSIVSINALMLTSPSAKQEAIYFPTSLNATQPTFDMLVKVKLEESGLGNSA